MPAFLKFDHTQSTTWSGNANAEPSRFDDFDCYQKIPGIVHRGFVQGPLCDSDELLISTSSMEELTCQAEDQTVVEMDHLEVENSAIGMYASSGDFQATSEYIASYRSVLMKDPMF